MRLIAATGRGGPARLQRSGASAASRRQGRQDVVHTTSATTAATTFKAAPKAVQTRTAASLQCSKDADAKDVYGKPRKGSMSSCKKAAAKS